MHRLLEHLSKGESQNSRPRTSTQKSWRAAAYVPSTELERFSNHTGCPGGSLQHTAVFAYDSPTILNAAPCFWGVFFIIYLFLLSLPSLFQLSSQGHRTGAMAPRLRVYTLFSRKAKVWLPTTMPGGSHGL